MWMSGTFQVCCSQHAVMHHSTLTGKVENKAAVSFQLEDSLTPSTSKTINKTPHPNSNRGGCLIIPIMHMKMCMPIPFHCVCVYDNVIILIFDFKTCCVCACMCVCIFWSVLILWQPFLEMCLAFLYCPVEVSCETGSWWMCEYEHGNFQLQGKKKREFRRMSLCHRRELPQCAW